MAQDLFLSASSPAKLAEEIAKKMVEDNRSLPDRAKIFAAVAKMQEFDRFPDLKPPEEIERLIATGQYKELNRGLCGTNGIPALLYARELVRGQLYPGTQSAFGTGIYFADMGCPLKLQTPVASFPTVAKTAYEHCAAGENGVILRCLLKPDAKILTHEQVKELRRDNKNRFREAQLADCGCLTAALGFDGFSCDGIGTNKGELWFVIVNRTALIFQSTCLNQPSVILSNHEKAAT